MPDPTFFYCGNFSHGYLHILASELLNQEQESILRPIYASLRTDLHPLPRPAKSQKHRPGRHKIEAALEKVRSRTMAMHKSEEITQVAAAMFQALSSLGIEGLRRCVIYTFTADQTQLQCWYTTQQGQSFAYSFSMPLKGSKTMAKLISAWKSGRPTTIELSGVTYKNWGKFIRKHGWKYPKGEKPASLMLLNEFPFQYGLIEICTYSNLKPQYNDLAVRFAKVFEQTYTRFLDLQKAEAQAREAHIEAALEKVRSRSLAMHKSDELQEVVNEVFERMKELDLEIDSSSILIPSKDSKKIECWIQNGDYNNSSSFHIPYFDHQFSKDMWTAVKHVEKLFSFTYSFKQKNEWFKWAFKNSDFRDISKKRKKLVLEGEAYAVSWYFTKNAGIQLNRYSSNPFSDHENEILKRFARVFEQTYRRFLDLQKAEAQAREAQIEAALERVRARSMAMHNSDELSEVVAMMYEQMESLEFAKIGCEIILCNAETDQLHFWSSNVVQSQLPERYDIDRFSHPFFKKQWKAWKQKQDRLVITLEGKEKRDFDKFVFNKTDFKKFPDHLKSFVRSQKRDVFTHAVMKYGLLEAVDDSPLSEAKFQVLQRFAKVFEQTYTRFLDLQKAETQARQAQIEASLESVRAQAMAMQSSHDLGRVAETVFTELEKLDVSTIRCGIGIINEDSRCVDMWTTTTTDIGDLQEVVGNFFLSGHPLLDGIFENWLEQKTLNYTLEGKDLKNYYKLVANTNFHLPKSAIANIKKDRCITICA